MQKIGNRKDYRLVNNDMNGNKILKGKVIKKSSDKTIAVVVQNHSVDKKYKKPIAKSKKYLVHDENNIAQVGQEVSFKYLRPISKRKSYTLFEEN